jgi:hypothetical protein
MAQRELYINRIRSVMTVLVGLLACATTWLLADPLVRLRGVRRVV